VFHTEEIVIKPMSAKLRHIGLFSGMTILGDGAVVMVIDPTILAQSFTGAALSRSEASTDTAEPEPSARTDAVSLLIFRAGSERPKAVPLAIVSRIEEIDCRNIEIGNGRYIVKYRDELMPLFGFDTQVPIKNEGTQPIVVVSKGGRSIGLLIDAIADIAEEKLDIRMTGDRPGILGYALIRVAITEIIDVAFFLQAGGSLGRAA
jgi:two-component system chemotaxis sensor kinase CheA